MIRRATEDDLAALVAMTRRFHAAKEDAYPFDADSTRDFFANLIPGGGVFVSEGGFIAGAIAPAPANRAYLTAYEVLWWAEDMSGRALLKRFEEWAKASGCSAIHVSHPEGEGRVGVLLSRKGYKPAGRMLEKKQCA